KMKVVHRLPSIVHRRSSAQRHARVIHDLRRGEQVIVLLRRHPAALLTALAWPLLLLAIWAVSLLFVAPFIAGLQVDPLVVANAPPAWLVPSLWLAWLGAGAL